MVGGWEWPPPQNPKTMLARSVSQGPVRPRPRGPGTSEDPHIHPTVPQSTCDGDAHAPPFGGSVGTWTVRYAGSCSRTPENNPSTHSGE